MNGILSKIWEYWTDVHLCVVKLESGDQLLQIIKKQTYKQTNKNSLEIVLTLKNPLFYQKY